MRIMSFSNSTAAIAAFLSLGGCTVLPSVEYRAIVDSTSMLGMTDSYYRNQSRLELSTLPDGKVNIVSKPVDFKQEKLGIRGIVNWRSSTVIAVNKTPDSDRVNSIGSEVTDNTVKAINEYGGAAVKLFGLAAEGGPRPSPCIVPGATVFIENLENGKVYDGNNNVAGCIEVAIGALPPDALPYREIPKSAATHNYYYSSCRDATISVKEGNRVVASKTVRIADPAFVQFVQFPAKGNITMHSECGVSVLTQVNAIDNGAAVANAMFTQAAALRSAADAGNSKKQP